MHGEHTTDADCRLSITDARSYCARCRASKPKNKKGDTHDETNNRSKVRTHGLGIVLLLSLALMSQGAAAKPTRPQEDATSAAAEAQVTAAAQPLISYQGTLTNQTGVPVNATVTMQFRLYDAASGGAVKWGPETQSVQVTDGLFNVLLGSVTAINPANLTGDLWLDIKVNSEQLTPRERLTTVPYTIEAGTLPAGATTRGDLAVPGSLSTSGRIGIGVTSPAVPLHLEKDDGAAAGEHVLGTLRRNGSSGGGVVLSYQADGTAVTAGRVRSSAGFDLRLGTANYLDALTILNSNGNVGIGTTTPSRQLYVYRNSAGPNGIMVENGLATDSENPAQIDFKRTAVAASQWASVGMDYTGRDFFIWVNGADRLNIWDNGSVSCGALTEAGLQTPGEREAGGSDRFEEGDVLCWSAKAHRLERCVTPGDPLVQAVADSGGRPIVIGAEAVKVIGPVRAGDYLVASSVAGYAMASPAPTFGTVIAQALEDFDGEQGIIKAMIRKM